MVIKKAEDIFELLDERIETMEDLNCEELKACVKSFMQAYASLLEMEGAKLCHKVTKLKECRDRFSEYRDEAWAHVHAIDHLTLGTDAAE